MRVSKWVVGVILIGGLALVGCESDAAGASGDDVDSSGTTDGLGGEDVASRGADSSGTTDGLGGEPETGPGGEQIGDLETVSGGLCATTSLGDVMDAIVAGWPDLPEVPVMQPDTGTDGVDRSLAYAWRLSESFRVIVYQGMDDGCPPESPMGCEDPEWWYFETDGACAPRQVGHYLQTSTGDGCLEVQGEPMWNFPSAPSASDLCE